MRSILTLVFLSFFLNINAQGIDFFHGTWEEALEKASSENKLIFADAFTTWCGPCKRMSKNVFTQAAVGKVYNAKFINVKMDMEKEENMSFIKAYPVSAYPTLLFINGEGKVVHKSVGGKDAAGLLSLSEEATKKDDRSGKYVEAYESGDRSYDLVYNYIAALNKVGKPSLKISNEYWKSKPKITEDEKCKFLLEAVCDADSKLFNELVDRKEQTIKNCGQAAFDKKILSACNKTVDKAIEFEVFDLVQEAIEKYNKHTSNPSKAYSYESDMKYYDRLGMLSEYLTISEKYLKKEAKKDDKKLISLITTLRTKHISDPQGQKIIKSAYKEMLKRYDAWNHRLSYAEVLLTLKENKSALKEAKKALEMIPEEDQRSQATAKAYIKKIEATLS